MLGRIVQGVPPFGPLPPLSDPNTRNLVAEVSIKVIESAAYSFINVINYPEQRLQNRNCNKRLFLIFHQFLQFTCIQFQEKIIFNPNGEVTIVAIDCGLKYNQIRCLVKRNAKVILVPWNYKVNVSEYDGLFISNGPGDPEVCKQVVDNIRAVMKDKVKPIFGICLGHQLLSTAAGCNTYKTR